MKDAVASSGVSMEVIMRRASAFRGFVWGIHDEFKGRLDVGGGERAAS